MVVIRVDVALAPDLEPWECPSVDAWKAARVQGQVLYMDAVEAISCTLHARLRLRVLPPPRGRPIRR